MACASRPGGGQTDRDTIGTKRRSNQMSPTRPNTIRELLAGLVAGALAGVVLAGATVGIAAAASPIQGAVVNGTLEISGSDAGERIALRLNASADRLQVDAGDNDSADLEFSLGSFAS